MYRPPETTDDTKPSYEFPNYMEQWYKDYEPYVNWTWHWPECLICRNHFYYCTDNLTKILTPEGVLIGYLCSSCSKRYEIVVKDKKASNE